MSDGLVWEKVVWRHGDGRYTFEVDRGGLHATLTTPHGRSLTIPTIAWYGLLDALAAARRTGTRAERPGPPRHGQRWSEVETEDLVAGFQAGVPVEGLAQRHSRSRPAVETQLAKLGFLDPVTGGPATFSASGLSRAASSNDHGQLAAGGSRGTTWDDGPPGPEPPWPMVHPHEAHSHEVRRPQSSTRAPPVPTSIPARGEQEAAVGGVASAIAGTSGGRAGVQGGAGARHRGGGSPLEA